MSIGIRTASGYAATVSVTYVIYRITKWMFKPASFSSLPGPPASHWLLGNFPEIASVAQTDEMYDLQEKWAEEHGSTYAVPSLFLVSDSLDFDLAKFYNILLSKTLSSPWISRHCHMY
jgi:hypothetical protein